ncbi:TRAP transporter substrate-binding protein [Dethiosulfatarculus sandiegensis]|uniref:C4-dicarboxylate ABC transporter substrate-binding protein n=1 Tax=Dethiosulfatarculus sandiegensis TaxID=1429043 RepID=A0A0D2HMC1_9BACT|nr:TRAP transporter substrate-binding protein [Dethiosulfatarculus sandiegensis]KIX11758.1 hypothetical protein X474_22690 [Dethiosulfatarculus sandiegensis]
MGLAKGFLPRTGLLGAAVFLLIGLTWGSGAWAADLKLTFASTTPPKSNLELASARFVKAITDKTGGKVKITHYGAGKLYNAKTINSAISKGQVDMGILHVALVGRRSSVLEFIGSFGAQGCWQSYDHYFRFLDTPKVRELASREFEKYFKSRILGAWAFGTALAGRRESPIKKVSDYQGLKMRTSGTAQATMYKALGAVPVDLSAKEIYTALQRGTIDGVTSGMSRWRRSKLYEVAPYLTVDPTLPYLSMWFVISQKAWKRLSPDQQKLFMQTAAEVEAWTRKNAAKERAQDLAFLKGKAKALVEFSADERKKLVETVVPVMKEYSKGQLKDKYQELWDLLDQAK